jgi:mono/diheme cytochrome c family protein
MGKLCVAALAISAAYQGWALVESVPGLVGTAYGWTIMVKLVLFAVLLAFAWANRYRLAPALLRENAGIAKAALVRSVAVQTMFGMAIIGAAAVLSSLPPSMHVQPYWPFADRFTLDTIGEDPDFQNEVLWATGALGVALALVVLAAVIRRRVRWAAAAGAVAIAWFAIPHLDLLFVPAYPTSYYSSPTNFAVTSIARGAELFPADCAACHGPTGRGDGPAAKTLPVPPADLTASHLWMHSDGELFWWLSHGMEGPEGQLAMPGFASVLTEDERWNLIDYIRAHNAGLVFARTGSWSPAVMAPELQATCEGGRSVTLQDLRGTFVRLVLGPAPAVPVPGLLTVTTAGGVPVPGTCVADDTLISRAYAVVSGAAPGDMAGEQFLIDGAGVLRAAWKPGAAPDWTDPQVLSGTIRELEAHPVSPAAPGGTMNMPM